MTGLLDGADVPWDLISGPTPPGGYAVPRPVREPQALQPAQLEPVPTGRRLVAGGLFVASVLATHWRRGRP